MQQKHFNQSGVVDADTFYAPRAKNIDPISIKARSLATVIIGAAASLASLIAMIAIMISNYHLFVSSMSLLLQLLVWSLMIGIPVFGFGFCLTLSVKGLKNLAREANGFFDQRAERLRLNALNEAKTEVLKAEAEEIRARAIACMRSVTFDANGNAAIIGVDVENVYQLRGQYPQPVLKSIANNGLLEPGSEQPTSIKLAPSQDYLISRLEPNSLTVSPGIRNSDGQVVVVSIIDIPHLKIIGSSGFGKSCLAAALLDQACVLNTPDKLQIALLDLEHKTSRLFEDRANLAELNIGTRRVTMLATEADEVAQHLGFLKKELSRRTKLSEYDLQREPVLLMYVEEMLSLQFEVDEELLQQMLADITILAIRGRKYGMFLLAVSQTDYSTEDLRIAQKQFRFRAAAGIDVTAARAAGFMNTALIKNNFQNGKPGQFVVEYPSFSDLVLAPDYDVKKLVQSVNTPRSVQVVNSTRTAYEQPQNIADEQALQANLEAVRALRVQNWGKISIIEKIWGVKRGGSQAYRDACAEYDMIVRYLDEENV